jgi:hypothetical protein
MNDIEEIKDITTLYGDNNGAIFISRHSQHIGPGTKHIDVRYHFMHEIIANGKLLYEK